ncbi:MAG: class I SAM-dependent methyltransferase [Chloroflexi bacterium]|nr:class I SAM-dependent methyltransferase [Chloroflexota bacterium]
MPDLRVAGQYVSPIPRDVMARLLAVAGQGDWRSALHDELRRYDRSLHRWATDELRTGWRMVLPLSGESRVLEVGAGLGGAAFLLAEVCRAVVALDPSWEHARFTQLRCRSEGRANVYPICAGDQPVLPFPTGTFDIVVLNGVAEQAGRWFGDLVTGATRVLRPEGTLYLGILNRLGLHRLAASGRSLVGGRLTPTGKCDGGTPEWVGNTLRGYQQLLRAAGCAQMEVFYPLPYHHQPMYLVPLDDPRTVAYCLKILFEAYDWELRVQQQGLGPLFRLARLGSRLAVRLGLTGLLRYLVPSYGIVAVKGGRDASSASETIDRRMARAEAA